MKVYFSILVLVVISFHGHNSCNGRLALTPFPLGTIGCLISEVCGSREVCSDDNLFGSCQNIFTRELTGEPKFKLEKDEADLLGTAIELLIKAGFTWKDAFTQCTLQNTLMAFTRRHLFNPKHCKDALSLSDDELTERANEEIAAVLLQLLDSGDIRLIDDGGIEEDESKLDGFNSNKRDEIVQVHKYFDKSKGQLKRDPYEDNVQNDATYPYLFPSENEEDVDEDSRYLEALSAYNSRLRAANDQNGDFPVFETTRFDGDTGDDVGNAAMNSDTNSLPEAANSAKTAETPSEENYLNSEALSASDLQDDDLDLSPEDEQTLELLLDGTIQPEQLDNEQQKRLQRIIEGLITLLDTHDGVTPPNEEQQEIIPSLDELEMSNPGQEFQEMAEIDGDDNEDAEDSSALENKRDDIVYSEPERDNDGEMKLDVARAPIIHQLATDGDDEAPKESRTSPTPIDTHSMYMQLSKEVDTPTGIMFVHNLTRILKLPPGMIGFVEVGPDNLINLEINIDSDDNWDAEKIAKETLTVKDQLNKETGIFVLRAGIGREENGVEVKESNRNIVLTFILVGSIAGVVLAVLTIYLIKRHAKFKQKLAQMAGNPDGNEASKDYQDLCRQRMQGKSSEKPEPLHAASRIGSVSESQARSPSSRSSTSSWSEEPAATNMDISTGHIVLSYMEDHLKNQDRLDKEWEAVSSYSADPSSTKMATDQSNTRKNRFADILPYDHSRVVLSSNANVANSDYINANFITDHDPRNPAYICTQGPLPHTVADFWQMIWEQGSVVIVMLTKLAENGTSLCHRYWPEEGSDLYHIYEVHLVSEHIWCDDYLVRSFYLKNLQTNETRTVTQFHFLTWPQLSVPASIKALLDFRRKVNKSFRGRSCPIVVHCSDGCGRSGTYCLIDMVLNKMAKGAKEIDMAATLEHIRDQRMSMVKTKEQFQFSLAAVAEEVHAILKALPQ